MVRIGWLGVVVGLVGCSGAPKADDTDLPGDTDAADTDVVVDTDETADTDVVIDTATDGDADGADASVDCDDADPAVHPGAAERCNGVDDDCDPLTSEDGRATWVGEDGTVRALDQEWASGSVTLDAPGTLTVCEGVFAHSTNIQADTTVVGAGQYDESAGTGTLLQAPDSGTAFVVSDLAGLFLRDLTLRGGADAAGLDCTNGLVSLERVSLERFDKPGIDADGCEVSLLSVYILDNAVGDGVVKVSGGTFTADTLIASRNSGQAAGVLRLSALSSEATIANSEFRENTSGEGVVRLLTANASFGSTTFAYNTGTHGGAVNAEGSVVHFTSADLSNNSADEGGVVYAQDGSLSFSASWLLDNQSSGAGGAVSSHGTTVTVSDDTHVERNDADGSGGGFACDGGSLTVTGGQWITNHATVGGGAVYNVANCDLTTTDVLATGNTTDGRGGYMYAVNAGFQLSGVDIQDSAAAEGGTFAASIDDGNRHDGVITDGQVVRTTGTAGPGTMLLTATDGGIMLQVQSMTFEASSSHDVGAIVFRAQTEPAWVEADVADTSFLALSEQAFTLDGIWVRSLDVTRTDFPDLGIPDLTWPIFSIGEDFGLDQTAGCTYWGCF